MKYRVDIDAANSTKAGFGEFIDGRDSRVLNRVGAFASLFKLDVGRFSEPVLVLKTEEPGSKQVLAFAHDRVESLCYDMINHLINDCVVMGAEPLAVQDLIICGRLDGALAKRIVKACAEACTAQNCVLTGGETTEQPDVVPPDTYVLGSSIVGIAERSRVIDGTQIREGDVVVGVASSGPHTNGFTLIRDLLSADPALEGVEVGGQSFIEAVLEPHRCYYQSLKGLFPSDSLAGIAHITGGGIRENLDRILPSNLDALIDLGKYRTPSVFRVIRDAGRVRHSEMLRTFNLGIGLAVVCPREHTDAVRQHLNDAGEIAYQIGEIVAGEGKVRCTGAVRFGA